MPLLFGQAVAYATHGAFSFGWLAFLAVWGIADQLYIVFANDYADREADGPSRTPFSGGSGVLVEGRIEPRALLRAAVAMALFLVALSAGGAFAGRPLLVGSAAVALALLHAYSFPPLRLSYRGGGALLQGLGVGVVLPFTAFYAQSGRVDLPLWALAPSFLAGVGGNLLTAVPDIEQDARAAKRTLAVRAGEGAAVTAAIALLLAAFVLPQNLAGRFAPQVAVAVAAALLLALAAHVGLRGRPRSRGRVLFVLFGGAAQHGFFLAWCAALARA